METSVKSLRDAFDIVAPAIGKGNNAPDSTKFVYVGYGEVRATNIDTTIQVQLPEVGEEEFLLPYKELDALLRFAPASQTIGLRKVRNSLEVKTGNSKVTLNFEDPGSFPPVPGAMGDPVAIDGDKFLELVRQVAPYAKVQGERPILNGIAMQVDEDGLNTQLIGADGFRVAFNRLPGVSLGQDIVVHRNDLATLGKLWKKADKRPSGSTPSTGAFLGGPSMEIAMAVVAKRHLQVSISETGRNVRFAVGGLAFTATLLTGTYPKVESLIPKTSDCKVVVDAEEMYRAIQQLKVLATQGSNIIRLVWDQNMVLSTAVAEGGKGEVEIPLQGADQAGRIAFNFTYLEDFLADKFGHIMMETTTDSSPGLFTYRGHSGVVIMPMFVDWDGKGKKAKTGGEQTEAEPAGELEAAPAEAVAECSECGEDIGANDPHDPECSIGKSEEEPDTERDDGSPEEEAEEEQEPAEAEVAD